MPVTEAQLTEVDLFLSNESKVLDGFQPHWQYASGYDNWQITWPIFEEDTGRVRSHLRFRVPSMDFSHPSISLILSGQKIARLDKTEHEKCEPNPPIAGRFGLPAEVCGNHFHPWPENRYVIASSGKWELPIRSPVDDDFPRLDDMFFWFCREIGVRIQRDNTPLAPPPSSLFNRC